MRWWQGWRFVRTIPIAFLTLGGPATPLPKVAAPVAQTAIVVESYNSKLPARIMFDGQRAFVRKGQTLVGSIGRTSFWLFHDLAISSGEYEIPVTILSPADVSQMRIWLYDPRETVCDRPTTARILETMPDAGTINERMVRMMQARKIAAMDDGRCRRMRRQMDIAYFKLNCALAKAPNSPFALSHDAQVRFAGAQPGPNGDRERRNCLGAAEIRVLKPLLDEQIATGQGDDPEALARISRILLGYVSEPAWQAGFTALKIDADYVRARHLNALYAMQKDAGDRSDTKGALAINATLISLCNRRDFKPICGLTKLGGNTLTNDAAYYQTILRQTGA